jgi:hypothetical protein
VAEETVPGIVGQIPLWEFSYLQPGSSKENIS